MMCAMKPNNAYPLSVSLEGVRSATNTSHFIKAVQAAASAFDGPHFRPLVCPHTLPKSPRAGLSQVSLPSPDERGAGPA